MKQLLITTLEALGYPVFMQGTISETLPETFFTFSTLSSDDAFIFDDVPTKTAWEYSVILYSNNPRTLETVAEESRKALKAAGFIPQGKGVDLVSDEKDYTAWATEYKYISNY